jgi:predicted PurR-regulated permease PerM
VQLSLGMAIYTLVVLIVLEVVVKPRLFTHKHYNPIVTVVILIALAKTFGLIGIVVAPPLSAAIQILWSYLFIHRMASGSASKLSDLQERHSLLRTAIQASSETSSPIVTSSMARLTRLLEEAGPFLQDDLPVQPSERSEFGLPQMAETNIP